VGSEVIEMSNRPETMGAVVCHGPRDYRLETVAVPEPGPGEALVRVEAVGVCASDLKCFHGAPKFWGDGTRAGYVEPGVVPGHEFVGEIVELDDDAVQRWGVAVGDRVVAEQIVPCGECRFCRDGAYWMCEPQAIYGFKRRVNGAMAEYMVFTAQSRVHRVSPALAAHHAAFAEPLSCALHAVERARITFGDVVVVAGCGPIGLGMVAGSVAKSAGRVVALDRYPARLDLARKTGATDVIDVTSVDPIEAVKAMTAGYGADVYFEASGHPSAVGQGLQLLRKLGRYVEYSVFGAEASVDWTIVGDDKELDILGAHLGPHCWPKAIELIEHDALPLDGICSHQLPLARFEEAFDLVASADRSVKVSLLP
jgi:threonine dehydrogenase-like Zn-dependent dehydrogenase